MSTLKPLIADIMVGQRIDDSLILAAHPDERMMPNGWEPSRSRRTLVLRFDGQRASFVEQFPEPLVRAWNSDNGSAYCTPVRGNYIYIFSDGKWQRESFAHDDEAVHYVWGWSGDGRGSDTVFIATDGALFVRSDGRWQRRCPAPLATRVYGMHGRDIKQIRVCSNEGLLLWNGTDFEEADGPHDAVRFLAIPWTRAWVVSWMPPFLH